MAREIIQAPIPAGIVDKLAKIAGLLGSDCDGERSAAAFQASRILFEHRLTWRQVIEAAGPREPIVVIREESRSHPDWRTRLRRCQQCAELLSDWDCRFCASLSRWHGRPTQKQLAVLDRIYDRLWS